MGNCADHDPNNEYQALLIAIKSMEAHSRIVLGKLLSLENRGAVGGVTDQSLYGSFGHCYTASPSGWTDAHCVCRQLNLSAL